MIRIGITGSNGFLGYHLYNSLELFREEFVLIQFQRICFEDDSLMDEFVSSCDVIIHLAAINRHEDSKFLYDTNLFLVEQIISSLLRTKNSPHFIFTSSIHEERDNFYGKSKRDCRLLLSKWANENGGRFTGLIIPNVFGPFGIPFFNSVVATFSHQILKGESTKIDVNGDLKLIYVGDLVKKIIKVIREGDYLHELFIPYSVQAKVSDILLTLESFKTAYKDRGEIPALNSSFELQLFNTFRSYIDLSHYFPKEFVKKSDERGYFVEIGRQGIPGQISFSTSLPGITRGNHFHTRKIERFAVIKGNALISLRKIGSDEVHEFYLNGDKPAYVDMPIWYTHNIKNIGTDILYTIFWINEPFDPNNPDTYTEVV